VVKLLSDSHEIKDKIVKQIVTGDRCPNRTSITIVDHNTGEILQEIHNKIVVPGGQVAAMKLWGLDRKVDFPTYDVDMGLDKAPTESYGKEKNDNGNPIICLWCAGRDGFLSSPNEEIIVTNTDRIQPTTVVTVDGKKKTFRCLKGVPQDSEGEILTGMIPFRYVTTTNDLDSNNREIYYGRKAFEDGYVGYYFKGFDTAPQMFISYLDSTDVNEDMWEVNSTQQVEVYVETRLGINRLDFRDYFDKVLGWENADISSISLLIAYPIESDNETNSNGDAILYYRDVIPYSKLNFKAEDLKDLNTALDFIYRVYY